MDGSLEQLLKLLEQAPVMGKFHPLLPLALPRDVIVVDSAPELASTLDAPEPHKERPILINDFDTYYAHRFLVHHLNERPPIEALNQYIPERLVSETSILRQSGVASRIVHDYLAHGYQTVVLLLIDGLSYEDVRRWPEHVEPCLIDGPSITFGRNRTGQVAKDVGFARTLGNPPLGRRLHEHGLRHSRGYSYWTRQQNEVSKMLFAGVPLQSVDSFSEAIKHLNDENLAGYYVQIIREGTDGLAHRRREVQPLQVRSTVEAIHSDLRRLVELLANKELRSAIYLTSDHGMLWKQEHDFELVPAPEAVSARYSLEKPSNVACVAAVPVAAQTYYLYKYPYISRRIRSNDSGVHGGVSYLESVVPFVKIEVNQ